VAAHERIKAAARQAIRRVSEMPAYQLSTPVELEMVLGDSSMTAAAAMIPGVRRSGDRTISYTAPDAHTAYNLCRTALALIGTVVTRERG
jgi:D-aminopeptidase